MSQYAQEPKASNTKRAPKSQSTRKYLNLTKKEAAGLEKLKKRKDIVCFQTDKSWRLDPEAGVAGSRNSVSEYGRDVGSHKEGQ